MDYNNLENQTTAIEQGDNHSTTVSEGQNSTVVSTGKTYTQSELDTEMAKTRRATETEQQKKFLAKFGLKPGDEESLLKIKDVYDKSLSTEERLNNENETLKIQLQTANQQIEEKDYIIAALSTSTGIDLSQINMIVKMAKGLKDDKTTPDDAIKMVMDMIKVSNPNQQQQSNDNVPSGRKLEQQSDQKIPAPNPFKKEQWNLTEQGKIFKEDPERARKLAIDAGVQLVY